MKRSTNINQILALFVALFVATAFSACSDVSGPENQIISESFDQSFDKKDNNDNRGSRSNGNGADQPDPSWQYPGEGSVPGCGESDGFSSQETDCLKEWAFDENGKIYVCKYVTTPDNSEPSSEVIKRGNLGLVHVDPNSIRNNLPYFPRVFVGDTWQDKHYSSVVIDPFTGSYNLDNRKVEVIANYENYCKNFLSGDIIE